MKTLEAHFAKNKRRSTIDIHKFKLKQAFETNMRKSFYMHIMPASAKMYKRTNMASHHICDIQYFPTNCTKVLYFRSNVSACNLQNYFYSELGLTTATVYVPVN